MFVAFAKNQLDELSSTILRDKVHLLHERTFALINTGNIETSGEHWMGVVMNKYSNSCGYFDGFG